MVVASGGIGLTLGLDVPKLNARFSQVHNVTSNCEPAVAAGGAVPDNSGNKSIAVVPEDQIYENLTLVTPTIGLTTFETLHENISILGIEVGHGQQTWNQTPFELQLPTACFFFDVAKKTLSPSPPAIKVKGGEVSLADKTALFGKTTASMTVLALLMASL